MSRRRPRVAAAAAGVVSVALSLTLLLAAGVAASGCAVAQLQTARTVPAGEVRGTLGAGAVLNDLQHQRGGFAPTQVTPHLALRVGVHDRVDVGARLILGTGGAVDAKVNLAPLDAPYAVSLSVGLGAGGFLIGDGAWSLTAPVVALASYDLTSWLTPYVGVGYAFWWHFGYDDGLLAGAGPSRPGAAPTPAHYAARAGYGDGVLMLTVGSELHLDRQWSVLLEYGFWTQIVDDPGDFYDFVDTHLVQVGLAF